MGWTATRLTLVETGTRGMTLSTRYAAVSAMRLAPHEGQESHRLQLNATSLSWPQAPQRRAKFYTPSAGSYTREVQSATLDDLPASHCCSTALVNLAMLPLASAVPVTQSYPFMANCIECALAADQDSFQVRGLLLLTFEPTLVVTDAQFVRFEYAGSNLLAPFSVTLPGGGGDLLFDSEMGNAIAAAEWSAVKTRIEFHLDRMR